MRYIIIHYKDDILMGHSQTTSLGKFNIKDVLSLKESYTPVSIVPVVMFAKFAPYSRSWDFEFDDRKIDMIIQNGDIAESFIIFYNWCLEQIKRDQEKTLDDLLVTHMEDRGADFGSLMKEEDKDIYNRLKERIEKRKAEEKKEDDTPLTASVLEFKKFLSRASQKEQGDDEEDPKNFH